MAGRSVSRAWDGGSRGTHVKTPGAMPHNIDVMFKIVAAPSRVHRRSERTGFEGGKAERRYGQEVRSEASEHARRPMRERSIGQREKGKTSPRVARSRESSFRRVQAPRQCFVLERTKPFRLPRCAPRRCAGAVSVDVDTPTTPEHRDGDPRGWEPNAVSTRECLHETYFWGVER